MPGFWQRARAIYAAQHFKEFYSRTFSGKLSPFVAAAFVETRVKPNHLTILMIPTGILGGIILSLGFDWTFFWGGLLFVLVNILDAADGELARYTNSTSDFGDYLDRIAHYMTNTAIIMGLGVGLFASTGHSYLLPLAFIANSAIIGDDALRDLLVTCGIQTSEGGASARKTLKSGTKISMGTAGTVINAVSSNVAMFHIVTLLATIQVLVATTFLLEAYFVFAAVVTIGKLMFRARRIVVAYG